VDKSSGNKQQITITNDKGRLSKDEIDRMVNDAAKYAAEDERQQKKVSAKNGLESYTYTIRNTIQDPKIKEKLSEPDRKTLEKAVADTVKWMESNEQAEKEEFDHKLEELQGVATPIMTKLHGAAGGAGGAGGMPDFGGMGGAGGGDDDDSGGSTKGKSSKGPTVEELD